MLEAKDLTKRYEDGLLALDHLNLEVAQGELFCLLGANGAGKTTTINIFLDFIRPTAGAALVNGIEVAADPLAAKRHAAYVPENVMLYGSLTARQNLDFFARLAGRSPRHEEQEQALRRVGLPERAFNQRVGQFSKGMRQKLGIAIAMVKDASNVLLDEPTSGLDPKSAAEFMALLRSLRDDGKSIFMSTHDIFRARDHADRVGIMKEGRLVMLRTRAELEDEDLERLYLDYMEVEAAV
jgi:ABC-2 type transport system ATP-binding protein